MEEEATQKIMEGDTSEDDKAKPSEESKKEQEAKKAKEDEAETYGYMVGANDDGNLLASKPKEKKEEAPAI